MEKSRPILYKYLVSCGDNEQESFLTEHKHVFCMKYRANWLGVIVLLLIVSSILGGCKRGEDDPWFSIYPRISRITTDWQLTYYLLDAEDNITTNIQFSTTQCDVDSLAGTLLTKTLMQAEFEDSTLISSLSVTEGSEGSTKIYDVTLSYILTIRRDDYTVEGTYTYYNDIEAANVSGTFSTENNSWYWVSSPRSKAGITFINFPVIDANAIEDNGIPMRFVSEQTFDIRELRRDRMQLEINIDDSDFFESISDPYAVITDTDTLQNCVQTVNINALYTNSELLQFTQIGD